MMKKLQLSALLVFITVSFAFAQISTIISGQVTDTNGTPIANQAVYVLDTSSTALGGIVANFNAFTTNAQGFYGDTIMLGGNVGTLTFMLYDSCFGYVMTKHPYSPNTAIQGFTQNFVLCGNSGTANCNFTVAAQTLPGSTSVMFTSTHQPNPNTPSTYLWSFGDGDTSSIHSPIHTYAQPGTYVYCLLVDACPMVCDTVVVSNTGSPLQCNAEFVVDTINSQPGTVILWNTSNVMGGNPISTQVNFYWSFGDGTSSTQAYPTHNYANPGTYAVCLTIAATDSTGTGIFSCTSTHCDTITVDQNGNLIYKGTIMGWTLKVLDPNSIGVDEDALNQIVAYPNPASGFIKLKNPDAKSISYQLVNTNGQLVRQGDAQNTETTIEMMDLASGIYILRIQVEQSQKQLKIVKW